MTTESNDGTTIGEVNPLVKVDDIVELGRLLLKFSRIERATYHEDGLRKETDADHTVMLGILGCAVARQLRPDLDLGKVAQYALVHDLVEVYAGDTVTIDISETEKQEKMKRESAALSRITDEFSNSFPWLIETMLSYEALNTIEARFVKGIDKLMPKITHILNHGKYIRELGMTRVGLSKIYDKQISEMNTYSYDLPEIMILRDVIADVFMGIMFPDSPN
jgi:5'-deoxynucleotidase YfbR-like HD superfamily hydrolase